MHGGASWESPRAASRIATIEGMFHVRGNEITDTEEMVSSGAPIWTLGKVDPQLIASRVP